MASADLPAVQRMMAGHLADHEETVVGKSGNGKLPPKKRRESTNGAGSVQGDADPVKGHQEAGEKESRQKPPELPTREEFKRLLVKMKVGDKESLEDVRELLNTYPEIWQHAGNLAKISELAQIKTIAQRDKLGVGLFVRYVNALKEEIAGASPTPLERLAAERVVQCWLQVQHCDMACSDVNMPLPQLRFWASRQDAAHRRFISAMKALVMVRTLLPSATPRPAAGIPRLPEPEAGDTVESSGGEKARREAPDAVSGNGRMPHGPLPRAGEKQATGSHEGNGRLNGKLANRVFPILETADTK